MSEVLRNLEEDGRVVESPVEVLPPDPPSPAAFLLPVKP